MNAVVIQISKVVAVIVLLGAASAISTPKGRLPLALRGLFKTLGRELPSKLEPEISSVPLWKKIISLILVLAALTVAVI